MTPSISKDRRVIYTAIFGQKDELREPKFVPENCDFVCFTDQPFRSHSWKIVRVDPPVPGDPTRSNRYYKILAHRVLPDYEMSAYVDGNVLVRGDINELFDRYLGGANMAVFDHAKWKALPLRSLREEMEQLLSMEREGKHQEDPALMEKQATAYMADGFPDLGGLSWNLVLLRRHHAPDVVEAMEAWWQELLRWSKRDQISFNYIAWKKGLHFNYIPLDGSDNPYTKRLNHYLPWHRKLNNYRLGAIRRLKRILGRP